MARPKTILVGRVIKDRKEIEFEFGRSQAEFYMSGTGTHARRLKLKDGSIVRVTIERLEE